MTNEPKSYPHGKKGFASMSPEKRKAIAGLGGRAAHAQGKAHKWTSAEAAKAGRIGGILSRGGRGKLSED